jgi:hypothetical protein
MSDTTESTFGDWQDRLIAAAATVTIGPRATSEPIRLERLPSWINFEGIIDVEAAERRFELARQGRAFLPALAAWKREVLGLLHSEEPQDFGDDAGELFWDLSGVTALGDVLLEVGMVGGHDESHKPGTVDVETLDVHRPSSTTRPTGDRTARPRRWAWPTRRWNCPRGSTSTR